MGDGYLFDFFCVGLDDFLENGFNVDKIADGCGDDSDDGSADGSDDRCDDGYADGSDDG